MFKRNIVPVQICILLLSGSLLISQDCEAQTDPCDPDPCQGIQNAVPDTCTEIGGPCTGPNDFSCSCDPGYTWHDTTDTCQGGSLSFPVPDTGIEVCYDNGAAIECPAPGEPFYGQDAQYVTNPMSFTVGLDGFTVMDNVTGLVWQREDDDTTRKWDNAILYCEGLTLSGHTDWRLPNVYELQSIVDYGHYNPAIDTTAFPGTNSSDYWSSSTHADGTADAWYVYFEDGIVSYVNKSVTGTFYVRCVR